MNRSEYKTITSASLPQLEERIKDMIDDGFIPVGGLSIKGVGSLEALYSQTMYRKKREYKNIILVLLFLAVFGLMTQYPFQLIGH